MRRRRKKRVLIGVVVVLLLLAVAIAVVLVLREKAQPPPPPPVSPPPTVVVPTPTAIPRKKPVLVKGIYISGPIAGDASMEKLLALLDETELNTVVIDIKNDEGNITYRMNDKTAQEIGACIRYIQDVKGLMERLKEQNIYTIARVVAFKDPILAAAKPELAMCLPDGKPITDGAGLAWVNPYKKEVWDYLIDVSKEAVAVGFDEIQFDYVRFATGKDAQRMEFGPEALTKSKEDIIIDFVTYACEQLHPLGVRVSADVFGTIIGSKVDAALIGQDYARMAGVLDDICPMVYPSHYANGVFGIEVPDQEPYLTVLRAMEGSKRVLSDLPEEHCAGVRVWIQNFTATWVKGHIAYGAEELRAQIQAVYDAGYEQWILWNAKNTYTKDGLLSED